MASVLPPDDLDLSATVPGRPLRIVLLTFYNYESHALRIFHPLLKRRGHEVHSIFFKNYFTYQSPTAQEEDMVVELIERIRPDVLAVSVWSTYYQLAARLSRRVKASVKPLIVWGGIHPQTRPKDCLAHADVVCQGEGEYVLAELTDRVSQGRDITDLRGCWVKVGGQPKQNPPRPLIPDLDVLPPPDLSSENKHYLGVNAWRDVVRWDAAAIGYDIMAVRGCPFECTFCIHNFTRKASEGLGTYLRRRSVDHVMRELNEAKAQRPLLTTVAFSDDIFAPPRPWLEEFCARYKKEIGLPFIIFSFPRMVDDAKVRLMHDAGMRWTTLGIQSGSERIRRDCYERETSNEEIIEACRTLARYGVERNLDFIGDNPYETDEDRLETVDLLTQLPKPFYFNYFSLTYFPGVDLTERALRDGFIRTEDVEDVAEKGYHLWGGSLVTTRTPENLTWDIAYQLAVHGVPRGVIHRLIRSGTFRRNLQTVTRMVRSLREVARLKQRLVDRMHGRPNLIHQFWANTNRDQALPELFVQPNFDSSPFAHPIEPAIRRAS
jgi:anaerobic magnesium-protoporphyrin IX monomethyl ester cyclase